jgi:hypothetical protein
MFPIPGGGNFSYIKNRFYSDLQTHKPNYYRAIVLTTVERKFLWSNSMLSCAEQNSRAPEEDGAYKKLIIWEVPYERTDLLDESLKFENFSIKER